MIVYADHVEEFVEMRGFYHSTALNVHALKTVVYFHFPEMNNQIGIDATSSHLDILPTILDYLSTYHVFNFSSLKLNNGGRSLLKKIPEDRITFSAFHHRLVPFDYSYNFKDEVFQFTTTPDIDKLFLLESLNNFGK